MSNTPLDLEPIEITSANIKNIKPSPSLPLPSFITSERVIMVLACMMILAVFLPYATLEVTIMDKINNSETYSIISNNIFNAISVFIVAGFAVISSVRKIRKWIFSVILLDAVDVITVIIRSNVREASLAGIAEFKLYFHLGFYMYVIAASFLVLALIWNLMENNN